MNVALRQSLDLYACVRPFRYFYGVYSPVKYPERIDVCVFRENTEDVYAGIEWPFGSENAEKFSKFLCEDLKETKVFLGKMGLMVQMDIHHTFKMVIGISMV